MKQENLPSFDPAHDVLRYEHTALNAIFSPKNVAVIGASETHNSVGRTLMWNLISNPFGGAVFPVNPKRGSVLCCACWVCWRGIDISCVVSVYLCLKYMFR